MNHSSEQLSITVKIVNELGLHARSAVKIVQIAQHAKSNVWISRNGDRVDAKSIIDILTLACAKGTIVTISVEQEPDIAIIKDISTLIENGFGE